MKVASGQKVKVSLPKAFQTNKVQTESLAVKEVPTNIAETDFEAFLDLNNPDEVEALISQNLVCNVTGIVYKVEEFQALSSIMQCYNCQCFSHSAKTCRSKQKCLIRGENHSHKGCPSRELQKPTCANCKGPHVASYNGCPKYKKQAFRQHVVNNQKSYASVVSQNTLPQPQTTQTFTFTAEQLTKFVAKVVIQIAQPQVCYLNPQQDTLDLKSSMCHKVSNTAKTILKIGITGKDLFESIDPLSTPAPPPPKALHIHEYQSYPDLQTHLKITHNIKSTSPPSNCTKAVPKQPKTTK